MRDCVGYKEVYHVDEFFDSFIYLTSRLLAITFSLCFNVIEIWSIQLIKFYSIVALISVHGKKWNLRFKMFSLPSRQSPQVHSTTFSVANLEILSLHLATFQTPLATFFLSDKRQI